MNTRCLTILHRLKKAAAKSCKHKYDTNTININIVELSKQAVKEHKDIHKLVASKMFDVKYGDATDEQQHFAKTVDISYI